MTKDPAFLIYTNDFLEGTADFSAEEFGVFTRLVFHQHQRDVLPKEFKKLARLSGVSLSEFQEIWKEIGCKFIATDTLSDTYSVSGYVNKRCAKEVQRRTLYGRKKSILAVFGNWIKANKTLKKKDILIIKEYFTVDDFLDVDDEKKRKENILKYLDNFNLADAKRSHYTETITITKEEDIKIPSFEDFKNYSISKIQNLDLEKLNLKYQSWKENDWKDGNNNQIKNWKSKILNTLPYLKKENNVDSNPDLTKNR